MSPRRKSADKTLTVSSAIPPAHAVRPVGHHDPLRESAAESWARWSRDREIRDEVKKQSIVLANRALAEKAIHPLECAQTLAEEMKYVAPDWRAARGTLGPAWGRLLKQQPELSPELTRRREAILTTLFNHTPPELHPALADLRTLIDRRLEAHEAAAFLVGFESGRQREERERPATRRSIPARSGFRLHFAETP